MIVGVLLDMRLARSWFGQFVLQAIPWQPDWVDRTPEEQLACHAVVGETILAIREAVH